MPLHDLYSNRSRPETVDVLQYEDIPGKLRVQVWNIIAGALGGSYGNRYNSENHYRRLHDTVAHEHGCELLVLGRWSSHAEIIEACIKREQDILVWLDVVELASRVISNFNALSDHDRAMRGITIRPDDAISELNERFRRAGFGF